MKTVRIWSDFWSLFPHIRVKYDDLVFYSLYSVWILNIPYSDMFYTVTVADDKGFELIKNI